MAGYTIMFSDKHEMAIAIVGTTWCVGPEQVKEFREFMEKKLGLKMPPNGQLFKYDDPDFKPILYLYDSTQCIHLDDGWCLIHDLRPVVCRSYPFRMAIRGEGNMVYEVAPECATVKQWPAKRTMAERYDEMDAAELIGGHLQRFYKSPQPRWRYLKDRWTQIGKG